MPSKFQETTTSYSMKIPFFFLVFPFFFIFPFTNSGDTAVHNRRTLHQPFFPFDSPAAPPSSLSLSSSSDIPFTPPAEQPFFPKIPTPPPPPPASFPVNIPSVNLPNSPKPKLVSDKLTATAATLAIFAAIVAAVAIIVLLRIRKRRRYDDHDSTPFSNAKTHEQLDVTKTIIQDSSFHKLDSPELRPLPPLNTVRGKGRSENNIRNNHFEEEFEELHYSSSMVTGSGSRPAFVAMPVDYYESERIIGSGSSSCSSSSGSGYPARSLSLSTSPRASLSSIPSSPNSPDHVAIQNASTPPPPPPPPVRPPVEMFMENEENVGTSKPKLKPLHWDKVRASSDRETVWDQIKSSSFKLNEEMIETLFIVKTPKSPTTNRPIQPWPPASQETRVLDPKKSQNIAILLKALHVTIEEVCDALLEGNADMLGTELLESLLKMAPTKEEEWKLKQYKDDNPVKLGPAEKFLKAVLDVPFAFKRVDAMLYVSNFESEVEYLKQSFQTLEVACEELRNSRVFLKLLEAVLKTGNRMNVGTNRGDAHAFKLDTLLKLIDVKGTDGKTTLLHFVVQEIIKSEGARLSNTNDTKCRKLGLQLVANISSELLNVKKAASIDSEVLHSDVMKLSKGISDISQVVRLIDTISNRQRFLESMNMFMSTAEEEIIRIQTQESVVFSLVKEVTEYFHGNSAKEEAHPFRIFMVVRDFLNVLDRVCKEVGSINDRIVISPVLMNRTLLPVFTGGQESSSLDDESN